MKDAGQASPLLRQTLGTICLKEGLPEATIEYLQHAISQNPKHSASWKSYGKALLLKRNQDAIKAYETGISVVREKSNIQAVKEMIIFLKRLKK